MFVLSVITAILVGSGRSCTSSRTFIYKQLRDIGVFPIFIKKTKKKKKTGKRRALIYVHIQRLSKS